MLIDIAIVAAVILVGGVVGLCLGAVVREALEERRAERAQRAWLEAYARECDLFVIAKERTEDLRARVASHLMNPTRVVGR